MGGAPPVNARPCAQRKKSKLMRKPEYFIRYPKRSMSSRMRLTGLSKSSARIRRCDPRTVRAAPQFNPGPTNAKPAPWFVSLPDAGNFNAEIYRTFLQ